ncbi:MAG TPA: TonB-dependent receptor family protein [Chryseosolibacter sp.]
MKKLLPVLLLAISVSTFGQKFSIKGQLVDTLSNPLSSATVLLLNPKDSSLVNFVVGDVNGNFLLKNVSKGEHLLKVSFIGFRHFTKKITTPETAQVIELGKLKLIPVSNELEAIEIQAEKAPVVVKKDTIEFNASSFKTKQNAVVEDLLKKLPGVEVDNDGNITAQGEQVRNVTVDGKKFFGSDPKLATKNLPADAINKVQVFDKKSDQAAFSGIDDGSREKTINLELKEEKRHGAFGSVMAGVGTEGRYQGRASINKFNKSRQLSFLGMGNNVNEQGFSMEDYMNFTGGSQQMMGGGGGVRFSISSDNSNGVPMNFGNRANGIMSNIAGGANLNNQFTKNTELNGSYFFNYLDHQRDQNTFRENFLPEGAATGARNNFNFDQQSVTHNTNSNHRVNLTLDHRIDSANSLKLTSSFTYNETDAENRSTSRNLFPDNTLQSEMQRLSISSGTNTVLNSTLLWRHRFAKKGRTLSTNIQFNYGENLRDGFLDALTQNYFPRAFDTLFRQTSSQATLNSTYGAGVSYTEPLGGRKYLEANYSFRQNLNDVERIVNDISGDAPVYDEKLSNAYNSNYQYHRAGVNFRMNRSKYNFTLGASVQQTYLKGLLELRNIPIERDFQRLLPTVRFNYDFSTSKHLNFDYETSVQEPSIQELQPVVDNTDPQNIYEGNPNLQPAYAQSWRLNFNTFNPMNFMSFFTFVDVDYVTNAITNSRSIDEQFISTTKPVNVDNNMSVAGNATVSFPINKLKSRISVGGNIRNRRSINVLEDIASTINQQSAGGSFRYSYRYKEIFDLSLSARLERQLSDYEFQNDQIFVNNNYSAESNLTFLKNYQLSSSFEFLQYENRNNNYSQSIPLLNLSVSRFLLKNKTGELKLAINNMLDKALGVTQMANINYIERQTTNSLGRIFMVSFTYSINKQLNPMGMRRGGQMMRIIR